MKRFYYLLSLVTLLVTGCQDMRQEVTPASLSNVEKKLVLLGFLSPQDSILAIKVSITRPIADADFTTNYGKVTNAHVTLSRGTQTIQLTYNAKQDYYQADANEFPIRAGQTYVLAAQTPEGMQARGQCTIPEPIPLRSVRLDSTEDGHHQKQYFVRYYWQDSPQGRNYYQTAGAFVFIKSCASCKAGTLLKAETAPVLFESVGQVNTLLNDQTLNGKQLESYRGFLNQGTTQNTISTFTNLYAHATLKATLLNVDQAYYQYQQALELQRKSEGNPFAEPVLLPNNINGGLGCFAGYNKSSLVIDFK